MAKTLSFDLERLVGLGLDREAAEVVQDLPYDARVRAESVLASNSGNWGQWSEMLRAKDDRVLDALGGRGLKFDPRTRGRNVTAFVDGRQVAGPRVETQPLSAPEGVPTPPPQIPFGSFLEAIQSLPSDAAMAVDQWAGNLGRSLTTDEQQRFMSDPSGFVSEVTGWKPPDPVDPPYTGTPYLDPVDPPYTGPMFVQPPGTEVTGDPIPRGSVSRRIDTGEPHPAAFQPVDATGAPVERPAVTPGLRMDPTGNVVPQAPITGYVDQKGMRTPMASQEISPFGEKAPPPQFGPQAYFPGTREVNIPENRWPYTPYTGDPSVGSGDPGAPGGGTYGAYGDPSRGGLPEAWAGPMSGPNVHGQRGIDPGASAHPRDMWPAGKSVASEAPVQPGDRPPRSDVQPALAYDQPDPGAAAPPAAEPDPGTAAPWAADRPPGWEGSDRRRGVNEPWQFPMDSDVEGAISTMLSKLGGMNNPEEIAAVTNSILGLYNLPAQQYFQGKGPGALGSAENLYNMIAGAGTQPYSMPNAPDLGAEQFYRGGQPGAEAMQYALDQIGRTQVPLENLRDLAGRAGDYMESRTGDLVNPYREDVSERWRQREEDLRSSLAARGLSGSTIADRELNRLEGARGRELAAADLAFYQGVGPERRADINLVSNLLSNLFGQQMQGSQFALDRVGRYMGGVGQAESMDLMRREGERQRREAGWENLLTNLMATENIRNQRQQGMVQALSPLLSSLFKINVAPGTVAPLAPPQREQGMGFGQFMGNLVGSTLPRLVNPLWGNTD